MAYEKKKEGSKQEIAYQKIKAAIVNNEFKPDSMLVEGVLCERLGFSKTPVREALRRLNTEGFVECIPEKGTFVSKLSLDSFIGICHVREALEGMAARLCALRREDRVAGALRNSLKNLSEDLDHGQNSENVAEDMAFHHVIIEASHNERLIAFAHTLLDQIARFAATTADDPERLRRSYEEHMRVYEAIRSGKGEEAEKAIREHIRSVMEYQINRHYALNR